MTIGDIQLLIATILAILGAIGGIPQIIRWIKSKPHLKITKATIEKIPNENRHRLHLEVENETKWWRRDSDATDVKADWFMMDKDRVQWGHTAHQNISPYLSAGEKIPKDFSTPHRFKPEGNPHTIVVRIICREGANTKKKIVYVG